VFLQLCRLLQLPARLSRGQRIFAVTSLVGACVLLAHSQYYMPFMADDAFISFVYSRRFADGQGLTWADGQRVEGYSNLLWVLLLAVCSKLSIDLVPAARILGTLGVLAAQVAAVFAVTLLPERHYARRATWVGAWVTSLGVALSGPMAVWAIGGLEQGLLTGLVSSSWVLLAWRWQACKENPRAAILPAVLFGLAVWTRPDTPLLVVCAVLGAALYTYRHPKLVRALALYAAIPAGFFLLQLVFRLAYYHDFVPNTAHAKVAFTNVRFEQGRNYITDALASLAPLVLLALLGYDRERSRSGRALVGMLMTTLGLWCVYWMLVGGDIFPAYRHWVVLVPAVAILAGFAVAGMPQRNGFPVVTLSLLALAYLGNLQLKDSQNQRANSERWEWDNKRLGLTIKQAFAHADPLFASESAGAIVYYSQVRFVDMLGLNDKFAAKHPPKDFGRGMLGHDLGDVNYLEQRSPDGYVIGLDSRTGGAAIWVTSELGRQKWFRRDYREVEISNQAFESFRLQNIWIKLSGKLGIEESDDEVSVPAWLLSAPGSINFAGRGVVRPGGMVAELNPGTEYDLVGVPLAPGRWNVHSEPKGAVRLRSDSLQQVGENTFTSNGGTFNFKVACERALSAKRLVFERQR
jgi:arabinofuranosyltransferase